MDRWAEEAAQAEEELAMGVNLGKSNGLSIAKKFCKKARKRHRLLREAIERQELILPLLVLWSLTSHL